MNMVYQCETCNSLFEINMELKDMYKNSMIVCPICKSSNFKRTVM